MEQTRIRHDTDTGLWVVEVFSPLGFWIVQGEHQTKEDAEVDRHSWEAQT